ncbi:helix-turn-helix transcriptional regulator [Actinoplanes sp. NPDC049668]|uniref:AraC family transcriptional regulator n=1 Tax=unclassified Actinoplanes TaxID=2626549 RepID=UPI0033A485CC
MAYQDATRPTMTTLLDTDDLETAHRMLSLIYGVRRLAPADARSSLRVRQDDLGSFQLHHVTWGMNAEVTGDSMGCYYFGHMIDGAVTYQVGGDTITFSAGETFLCAYPDQPIQVGSEGMDGHYVALDGALLAQVASTAPRVAEPVRFTARYPVTGSGAAAWRDTCAYVRDTFVPEPVATSPLLLGGAARFLAAIALATFPNNALRDPTIEDRRDAHPRSLRRAVAFIEDNAHRDIGPADIAVAADVTIRTLQLAFRRHLDITPMAYLRRVRLSHAHQDLLAADPVTDTVTAVAGRWGFPSHSRFTADYRAVYGTTPSHTLRRG